MQSFLVSRLVGVVFVLALAVNAATVSAADADDTARGYGPGYMMGGGYGMGPGMMGGGYGGYGMGPGMMGGGYGGYGMGPGMMGGGYGGYGMGPGMMGGDGSGYGMMGMMGPGMMGYGGFYGLDLSDAQREKINKILDGERKQMWATMGSMMDAQSKLRDVYDTDQPDPKKVGAVYGEIAKMQQRMIESQVQAQNQIRSVFTKEQREQLREWNRGGWAQGWERRGPASGPGTAGRGNMPGGMMNR